MENSFINKRWPEKDLETLKCCPVCAGSDINTELVGVRDWAFNCAPGSWDFWRCKSCESLFLNPRPNLSSIGRAYEKYYTHASVATSQSLISKLTVKLRNECYYHWLGIEQSPRLNLKSSIFLFFLRPFFKPIFPLERLSSLPRGSLLDVGSGNGDFMMAASKMGYFADGLEIDSSAVTYARSNGLSVKQGSFEYLSSFTKTYDYVVCLHVIEHVHRPEELLQMLFRVLKPGGKLFLVWPNPRSFLLRWFGVHWRGLEAPRHLCLFSKLAIKNLIKNHPAEKISFVPSPAQTFSSSWLISGRSDGFLIKILNKLLFGITYFGKTSPTEDFICLELTKKSVF